MYCGITPIIIKKAEQCKIILVSTRSSEVFPLDDSVPEEKAEDAVEARGETPSNSIEPVENYKPHRVNLRNLISPKALSF